MLSEENKENKKSIQDKLSTIKYNCDENSHLHVDQNACAKCKDKPCTFVCPANVYSVNATTKEIVVQYENCLECGACRIACPKNKISWEYPKSGCGVILKNN